MSLEVERYEFDEGAAYRFAFGRRGFLQGLTGGALVVLAAARLEGQESGRGRPTSDRMPDEISAWLHVAEDSSVTVFTGKAEVGQNIRTSLTQAVAEELHVAPAAITMVMADTARTPYDMGTFGSRTTPIMNAQLRQVAAAARRLLISRAAEHWQVSPDEVRLDAGRLTRVGHDAVMAIGEITKGSPLVAVVREDEQTAPPSDWHVAGRPLAKVDGRAFVTGRHEYASDLSRPGMMVGRMIRPPRFGATIATLDATAAEAISGVRVVREGNFAGLVAPDRQSATRALAAVAVTWTGGSQASSTTLFEDLRKTAQPASERGSHTVGDLDAAWSSAARRFAATYTVAYIAHCPLEPRAAVAEWTDDRLTVWTGSQRPFGVHADLVEAFHLPSDHVRVIVPDTGSAYGGKHTGEAAIEAARLAKASGRPVSLVWTREEELTWAYFRPAGVIDVRSAVDAGHSLIAWEFHNYNSGGSGIETPYEIANQRVAFHASDSPLRQGSYRGLAATANHFARESHMDEVCVALGADPLAFRLAHLRNDRIAAVLRAAADRFGWASRRREKGRGVGLACGTEKGGYVATCAEVAVDGTDVRVVRATIAFECGAIVNPNGLKNQVEGALIQGLGGALFEAISFEDGRIANPRFADYRLPRFSDAPVVDCVLVNRPDLPSAGAGETPIVGIAPAIGNAIFDASGQRLRSMPLVPQGLPKAASHLLTPAPVEIAF
jgi:nicotinate dehydrogenase subunit B